MVTVAASVVKYLENTDPDPDRTYLVLTAPPDEERSPDPDRVAFIEVASISSVITFPEPEMTTETSSPLTVPAVMSPEPLHTILTSEPASGPDTKSPDPALTISLMCG